MRQIDDKWRNDPYNPTNEVEILDNLLKSYKFTAVNVKDIFNYKKFVFKRLINDKCSTICMDLQSLNYATCFDNCTFKYLESHENFRRSENEFNEVFSSYQKSGRNFFQS